jgi:hypothetical protein
MVFTLFSKCVLSKFFFVLFFIAVVGLGTVLQAGRSSPDEVDFSIYLILPAALWPWVRLGL